MSKLNIIQTPCKNFRLYGTPRSEKLDSIEVHSIGCPQNTGMNIVNNMNQTNPSGITHYVIDAEEEYTVYQLLPDTNTCWADGNKGNRCAISFEISESDYMRYTGGANFVVTNREKFMADLYRGYNTAVIFVAEKCKEYGWDPQEKLPDGRHRVWSHKEGHALGMSSNHGDPDHFWKEAGYTMDKFRADVKAAMENLNLFHVHTKYKTTCKLQVRKTPGGKAIKFTADMDKTKFVRTSTGTCKIRKDQVVECLEVKEYKGNVWIRIAEGWIAGHYKKKYKIEEYNEKISVRITKAKKVRIRKNHASTSKVVSFIEPGTYTIVKTYDKWGLLASGVGWINMNLKSVEKI